MHEHSYETGKQTVKQAKMYTDAWWT